MTDEETDVTIAEATSELVDDAPQAGAASSPKSTRLEEEGEIAADYLEELLDIADLDGDIELGVEHGRAAVEIVSDDATPGALQDFVGRDGEVLDALQELTRLAVQTRTGERSRLMLDVVGHRAAQRRELVALANETVARVRTGGEPVALAPMNPYQRKVIHDAVAGAGLASDSEGVEPNRRVVVRPAAD